MRAIFSEHGGIVEPGERSTLAQPVHQKDGTPSQAPPVANPGQHPFKDSASALCTGLAKDTAVYAAIGGGVMAE